MSPEPTMPDVVINAVFKWFGVTEPHHCPSCKQLHEEPNPEQLQKAQRVLRDMTWDSICGCYFIRYAGMTVGIELDGCIHT